MLTIYSCSFPLDTSDRDTGSRHNEGSPWALSTTRHAPASRKANGPARQGTTPLEKGGPRRAVIIIDVSWHLPYGFASIMKMVAPPRGMIVQQMALVTFVVDVTAIHAVVAIVHHRGPSF